MAYELINIPDLLFDYSRVLEYAKIRTVLQSMDPLALQRYDNAVAQTGAPLQNCFGFMDGTARLIAQGLTPINELFVTGIRESIRSNFNLFLFYFPVS